MSFTGFGRSPREGSQITGHKTPLFFATLGLVGTLAATSCKEPNNNTAAYNNQPIENVAQEMDITVNNRLDDIFNKLFAEGSNESIVTSRIIECPNGKITLSKGKDYMDIRVSNDGGDIRLYKKGGTYTYELYDENNNDILFQDPYKSCRESLEPIIGEINSVCGEERFKQNTNFKEENLGKGELHAQKMDSIVNKRFDDIFNELFAEGSNESIVTSRIIECPNGKITLSKGKDYMDIRVSGNNGGDRLYKNGGAYTYESYDENDNRLQRTTDKKSCIEFFGPIIWEINRAYGQEIFDPNINFKNTDSIPLTSVLPGNTDLAKDSIESAEEEFVNFFNILFGQGHIESGEKTTTSTIKTKYGEIIKLTKGDNYMCINDSYRDPNGDLCCVALDYTGGKFNHYIQVGNNDPIEIKDMESLPPDMFQTFKKTVNLTLQRTKKH